MSQTLVMVFLHINLPLLRPMRFLINNHHGFPLHLPTMRQLHQLWQLLQSVEDVRLHVDLMLTYQIQHLLTLLRARHQRPLDRNIPENQLLEGHAHLVRLCDLDEPAVHLCHGAAGRCRGGVLRHVDRGVDAEVVGGEFLNLGDQVVFGNAGIEYVLGPGTLAELECFVARVDCYHVEAHRFGHLDLSRRRGALVFESLEGDGGS